MKRKQNPQTWAALASALGVNPQLVSYHRRGGDSPPVEDVDGWRDFLAARGRTGALPADLRRRIGEEKLKLLSAQRRLAEKTLSESTDLVSRNEVERAIDRAVFIVFRRFEFLIESELPPLAANETDPHRIRTIFLDRWRALQASLREQFSLAGASADE